MYHHLDFLENLGGVKAFYTENGRGNWKDLTAEVAAEYDKLSEHFSMKKDNFVRMNQTHTDRVTSVDFSDGGSGVTRACPETSFDGMVTDNKGLMLLTIEADCVPVL